jgi:hypothetical protein
MAIKRLGIIFINICPPHMQHIQVPQQHRQSSQKTYLDKLTKTNTNLIAYRLISIQMKKRHVSLNPEASTLIKNQEKQKPVP